MRMRGGRHGTVGGAAHRTVRGAGVRAVGGALPGALLRAIGAGGLPGALGGTAAAGGCGGRDGVRAPPRNACCERGFVALGRAFGVAQRGERDEQIEPMAHGVEPGVGGAIGAVGAGEHVFGKLGRGSDGRGVVQGVLHCPRRTTCRRAGHPPAGPAAARVESRLTGP